MNSMAKQMDMFEEGGLMDEGGTVDPVSGNDVPPGSTQEEVRDDIPAQLSEGEFVFPADVVRFIGLEKLMKIRQRAKAGLQRMEDMGQMGNSEEAIMPDTLPFSIEDLDMEDEDEYNTPQEFNQGGMPVPDPSAGVYYNPAIKPTTGVAPTPVTAASSNIARSIPIAQAATPIQAGSSNQPAMFNNYKLPQAPVPTMPQRDDLPPFLGGVVPGVGSGIDFDEETYVNDAGQTITFRRYKDGSLKDTKGNVAVIPEGYKIKSEAEETVTTAPTTVETATVQDNGRDDNFEEDQAKMELDQSRVDAAKAMGYTNFAGIGQGILSTLGLTTLPEGTVTGIGFVSDGKGSIFDPLTGRPIAAGIKDALKNSWNEISSTLKGEDRLTRDLIAKGKEQETKFGRDFYKAAGVAKVDRIFAGIKDDIKDGKYGDVDFDDFSENYIDDVQKSIRAEAEKGNYITEDGRIANPFEAGNNRGGGEPQGSVVGVEETGPDRGPPPSASPRDGGRPGGTSTSSGRDASTGAGMNEGQGDNSRNDNDGPSGSNEAGAGAGGGYGLSHAKGGLVSQMKRSGLASKK